MSFACPYCQAGLTPRELKPGAYRPKCPKCGSAFVLRVEWAIAPTSDRLPPPAPPAPKRAPDTAYETGDYTDPESAPPPRPAAAAFATGEYTDPDPHVSGPPRPRPVDATGDFTEPDDTGPPEPEPGPVPMKVGSGKGRAAAAVAEPSADGDDVPPRLGGYEVLGVLGKGGMGAVLLGRQVSLDRKVALKVMHPRVAANPASAARFTREAFAAAQLVHHNVVQVYDIGDERGRPFFSMEYVPGESLAGRVRRAGRLPAEEAVGLTLQAARGLRYGHKQGMVHRDVKPDNLMVNDEGLVKVADLGLVKVGPEAAVGEDGEPNDRLSGSLTLAGSAMGTPAYMAPEQAADATAVDHRADIYSLGCTLYVLLTGKPPFDGKSVSEILAKHRTAPVVPPETIAKRVPKAVSAAVAKMMAKDPADRFPTMDAVIAALEGLLGHDRGGPAGTSEAEADALEKAACQFNVRSKDGLRKKLAAGFAVVCAAGVVGAALAGRPGLAGGLVGLLVMTPLAYLVVRGVLSGGVVWTRLRAVAFGMRFVDWLMWAGGGALALATLYLFGLLLPWLLAAAGAVGLAFLLWVIADRPEGAGQEQPVEDARALFRTLRARGLDEEAVRRFAAGSAGEGWEGLFEAVFGYEAKVAARATRAAADGPGRTAGAWREPLIAWADARLDARRQARERKLLRKAEAKALEAEGVGKAEARARADALAADLLDGAAEAKKARKEGREAYVAALVAVARRQRAARPSVAARAGLGLKHLLDDWLGRRLRLAVGAALFAAGLVWMNQNGLLDEGNSVFRKALAGDFAGAADGLNATHPPPRLGPVPPELLAPLNSYAAPLTGLMLLLSGLLYFGWKPTVAAAAGVAVGLFGESFGVPAVGPVSARLVSLAAAAVLILGVGRLLRR